MPTLEIPRATIDPSLFDLYDPAVWNAMRSAEALENMPSPTPNKIGQVANQTAFSRVVDLTTLPYNSACGGQGYEYDLPLSRTGVIGYEIPDGLEQFEETIATIAGHEHSYYPNRRYEQARLTVEQTLVAAGLPQRGSGTDGAPNVHRDRKFDRMYAAADKEAPVNIVSSKSINARLVSPRRPDALPEGAYLFGANPYDIIQWNKLSLHYSPIFPYAAVRTFLRMSYRYAI